jgi:uncharacterized membrane protein
MKHKKTILGIGIVFLFGIFACLPLFGNGYIPTHDGEYHIIRFIEFFRMLSAGYWFPRWAPTLNSGYGIPIFLFHYPFPNYIGALIHVLGFHAVSSFQLSLALGYITAGIFSFLWLQKLFGTKAGLVGAILGAFVPYWFVELYVRGSVGEVWAIGFVFAAFMFLEYRMLILYSFAIAGLILSHNILAMLFIPFLFGYAFFRNRKYIIGILFGILLSSYFWIPAIFERVYVVGLNTVNFREHFVQLYEFLIPSWGTELSGQMFVGNKMSFQIGIVPLAVIIGSIIVAWKEKNPATKRLYWYFIFVFLCAVVLMLSWSSFIWEHLTFFSFVQYPWRFLSIIIPVTAFVGAYVSHHIRMRFWSIVLIGASIAFSYAYTRPVVYAPRDGHYYTSRINFTDGTSSMGNSFSTIWTGWKSKRSPYVIEVANGKVVGDFRRNSYLDKEFTVSSDNGANVYTPILYYPGWKAIVDQKETPIDYTTDGTIKFEVPGGKHQVTVVFTQTMIRKCADMLSVVTLVWLLGWGILGVYANRHRHNASS